MGQDTGTRKGVTWAEEGKTKDERDNVSAHTDEEKGQHGRPNSRWRPWRNWQWKKLRGTLSHIGLLLTLTGYTAAGGLVFRALEQPAEAARLLSLQRAMLSQRADLVAALSSNSETALRLLPFYEEALSAAARAGLAPPPDDTTNPLSLKEEPPPAPPSRWSILQAVFFASTVLTTIGYGNLVPVTVAGRAFCLLFALVGIPLTMTVIADMGRLLAEGVAALPCCNVCRRWWQHGEGAGRRALLALLAVALLLIYLAVGAALFTFWEKDWSFFDGFYFCFITMTTIGFGDLVPSEPSYMLLCTVYILSGLALTSTIIELVRRQYASSWKRLQKLSGPILADTIRRLSVAPTGLSGLAGLAGLAGLNGEVQLRRALAASLARAAAANGGTGLNLGDGDLDLGKGYLDLSGTGLALSGGGLNKDMTSNSDKSDQIVDDAVWKEALTAALRDLQRDSKPRARRPRVLEIIIYETSV